MFQLKAGSQFRADPALSLLPRWANRKDYIIGMMPNNHSRIQVTNVKFALLCTLQITGGAGFVGSHLVDRLMMEGQEVIVVDNFFTGRKRNVEHWIGHENFELIHHDIVNPLYIEVDQVSLNRISFYRMWGFL